MSAVTRTWRLSHSVERVWHALTDREELAAWLMPNDFAPQVGHRFTLRGGGALGLPAVVYCEVLEIHPPHRLVLAWSERPGPAETEVELTVRRVGDHTELRIHHRVTADVRMRAGREPQAWDWGDDVRRALGATLERSGGDARREVTL